MFKDRKLAIGIPTYKRPDFAIKLIKELISYQIYDQIIISSNSNEKKLNDFIKKNQNPQIVFNQQKENVGMAQNYFDIIKLCKCEFLHIISDEDSIYLDNARLLYDKICQNLNSSLIIVSVNTHEDKIYKDSSWQKNIHLRDSLGETAHIGSSIINRKMIDDAMLKNLYLYGKTKSAAYPTTAAAIVAYSGHGKIYYFKKPIVKMGKVNGYTDITSEEVYGFQARLHQYISLYDLFKKLKLKNKLVIGLYGLYYFTHHALQHSLRKHGNKPSKEFLKYYQTYPMHSIDKKIVYLFLILAFYFFYLYFKYRVALSKRIKPLLKK